MRTAGIVVLLCLAVATAAGCKNKGADANATPDPAAVRAQQQLVARREALLAEHKKLQGESAALQVQIDEARARGEDVDELARKKQALDQKIQGSETELSTTADQLSSIASTLDAAGGLAQREARLAEREQRLAAREAQFAERERGFAAREAQSAERWAASCSAPAQTIIQQVAPPKSGNYSRKEVDALVKRAKTAMAKKGLLSSDLGGSAGLEGEVIKAQQDSDWTRGYVLASQLVQVIDGIRVDRQFIGQKYQRLHNRVKAAHVDEATQAALTDGMKEVMQKYGDGDFVAANRRINQLWGSLK